MKFYECKAKYLKLQEDGKEKYVTEIYVFSATSFSEAEEKLKNEMDSFSSGEYDIVAIKIDNTNGIINYDSKDDKEMKWYKVKLNYITMDENTGKDKKTADYMLVFAMDIGEAKNLFVKFMSSTMADYEIERIAETKIIDVII